MTKKFVVIVEVVQTLTSNACCESYDQFASIMSSDNLFGFSGEVFA